MLFVGSFMNESKNFIFIILKLIYNLVFFIYYIEFILKFYYFKCVKNNINYIMKVSNF